MGIKVYFYHFSLIIYIPHISLSIQIEIFQMMLKNLQQLFGNYLLCLNKIFHL